MAAIQQLRNYVNTIRDDLGYKQYINGSIEIKSQQVNLVVFAATFLTYARKQPNALTLRSFFKILDYRTRKK